MPYIKIEDRKRLDTGITFLNVQIENEGELNYVISQLCAKYVRKVGINYKNLNSAIGVMECVKLEFSRRMVNSYEDSKIKENGDISEYKNKK